VQRAFLGELDAFDGAAAAGEWKAADWPDHLGGRAAEPGAARRQDRGCRRKGAGQEQSEEETWRADSKEQPPVNAAREKMEGDKSIEP